MQIDTSTFLRMAVEAFLGGHEGSTGGKKDCSDLVLPGEAYDFTPPFLAWSGDLRAELRRLFMKTLGCAWAARKLFPRTQIVVELYQGLLELSQLYTPDQGCPPCQKNRSFPANLPLDLMSRAVVDFDSIPSVPDEG